MSENMWIQTRCTSFYGGRGSHPTKKKRKVDGGGIRILWPVSIFKLAILSVKCLYKTRKLIKNTLFTFSMFSLRKVRHDKNIK